MAYGDERTFVWWTSIDDWDRVNTLIQGEVDLPAWPGYLKRMFKARGAPANAEKLLAATRFGGVRIEMVVGSPEHVITTGAVGIVIREQDIPAVIALPGFITDARMNFVGRVPSDIAAPAAKSTQTADPVGDDRAPRAQAGE